MHIVSIAGVAAAGPPQPPPDQCRTKDRGSAYTSPAPNDHGIRLPGRWPVATMQTNGARHRRPESRRVSASDVLAAPVLDTLEE